MFDFYYCVSSTAYYFFWVNHFEVFSTDSNSPSNFGFSDTHIIFLKRKNLVSFYLHFLLTLKPNADKTAEKNENVFYKCVLESHFTSISGVGGFIFSKKVKIVVSYCTLCTTLGFLI